jgi:hypothetical protein
LDTRAILEDAGEIKETQGRMDERLKALEKAEDARQEQSPESAPSPSKRKALMKTGAINISTAGLGGAILWGLQKLFGG